MGFVTMKNHHLVGLCVVFPTTLSKSKMIMKSVFIGIDFCLLIYGKNRLPGDSICNPTPWKFNIAPEHISSQKESSLPTIIFQGLC